MSFLEITGFILAVIGVVLATHQSVFTWIISVFSPIIYIFIFIDSKLYADALLQLFFIFLSVYGFIIWKRKTHTEPLPVRFILKKEIPVYVISVISLAFVLYFFLSRFTNSDVPLPDSMLTSLSVVATVMTAKKIIENWLVWVVTNSFYVILFCYKNLHLTALLYLLLGIMAIYGFKKWKKELIN